MSPWPCILEIAKELCWLWPTAATGCSGLAFFGGAPDLVRLCGLCCGAFCALLATSAAFRRLLRHLVFGFLSLTSPEVIAPSTQVVRRRLGEEQ